MSDAPAPAVRLNLMGRAELLRDDVPIELEPRFMAVLIRLALHLGRDVRIDDLARDALDRDRGVVARQADTAQVELWRSHVHKCVSAIRARLDPARRGRRSELLLTDSGRNPAYRLALEPEAVDVFRFEKLVADSITARPVRAMLYLERAVALWRGRPLVDVEDREWAKPRIRSLTETYEAARRRLFELYCDREDVRPAITLATDILRDHPDDDTLRAQVAGLVARPSAAEPLIQHRLSAGTAVINVYEQDLFEQHDAHLVVGFSDTFETNTTDDFLISAKSLQGQLLHRLYGGNHRALDRELAAALRDEPRTVENKKTLPHGKRTRFPIGTVAVLRQGGRRIFAVAYSRIQPRDVRAQATVAELIISLDQLWRSVGSAGQHRPVALGVLGSGLARISDVDKVSYLDLIRLIVTTFRARSAFTRIADELRIIVRPQDLLTHQTTIAMIEEAILAIDA